MSNNPNNKNDPSQLKQWRDHLWQGLTRTRSVDRLENSLPVLKNEIQALIEERAKDANYKYPYSWKTTAESLIKEAETAVKQNDGEKGWRCFMAADRFRLYGVDNDELKARAEAILREAKDKAAGWRYDTIRKLIATNDEQPILLTTLPIQNVVQAAATLHEHFNNDYQKLNIWKRRLNLLDVLSFCFLVTWFIYAPAINMDSAKGGTGKNLTAAATNTVPATNVTAAATNAVPATNVTASTTNTVARTNLAPAATNATPGSDARSNAVATTTKDSGTANDEELKKPEGRKEHREKWFGLVLMGILGALFSGFTATIGQDPGRAKIPYELSAFTITFARFFLGAISAIAVTMLAQCGLLNIEQLLTHEMLMAIAFVCGFSDRLLLRGIATLDK